MAGNGWKFENGQLVIRWGDKMFPQELEEVLLESDEDIDCDYESDTSSTYDSDFLEDESDSDEED